MKILQCNPGMSYSEHKDEIDRAVSETLVGGWYVLGSQVSSFEENFAAFCNSDFCVSCANGTDAIELVLRAIDVGDGDLVVTVSNTAVATVSAIERAGAIPIFVDVDPERFTMSPNALKKIIEKYPVKAIIPVHLFGHPADIKSICSIADQYNIPVIEDCAQAHGASVDGKKVGTFGVAGTFSFYPTKNLGAFGDGGAVVTNNANLKEMLISLRQYGWKERYISSEKGITRRLDQLQAAILNVKLQYLDEANIKRAKIANLYNSELDGIGDLLLPSASHDCEHVYHQYVIQTDRRDGLRDFLRNSQIGTAIHYPIPIHKQPAYSDCKYIDLSETERVNSRILSLPIYPELKIEEVLFVTEKIDLFLNR